MTYCVAIKVNDGIIFCSDSRTNAGIDQVNVYTKMYHFGEAGKYQLSILAAGNLATTQAVLNQVKKDLTSAAPSNLSSVNSIQEVAEYLGHISVEKQSITGGGQVFQASFIVGGQYNMEPHEIAMIYPEGNYITATSLTPFLQIGESKYGKPILDRIIKPSTDLQTCALCALVSMDSTIKSNLSVGPPIDIQFYQTNSLRPGDRFHFKEDDEYLKKINASWNDKLIDAFSQLPALDNSMAIFPANEV
jgi:putative proteasome-type protease